MSESLVRRIEAASRETVTREEITALVDRWRDAVQRHDVANLTTLYADACVVESPMAGSTVSGRAAIAQVFEAFFGAFPDVALTADELLIDGDRVALTFTAVGRDIGGFMGLPPTGRPISIPMVFLYTIADHQIVHERRIYDFTGMLVQIGVLKAKPA
jgi:steroid delta-isomerase-like uncharacterized protein